MTYRTLQNLVLACLIACSFAALAADVVLFRVGVDGVAYQTSGSTVVMATTTTTTTTTVPAVYKIAGTVTPNINGDLIAAGANKYTTRDGLWTVEAVHDVYSDNWMLYPTGLTPPFTVPHWADSVLGPVGTYAPQSGAVGTATINTP